MSTKGMWREAIRLAIEDIKKDPVPSVIIPVATALLTNLLIWLL